MADLDFITVVGRFGLTIADGGDLDEDPDIIWCDEGTVTFQPLNTFTKVSGGSPIGWSGGNAVIETPLDSSGYITRSSLRRVNVIDMTSSKVNPVVPSGKATHTLRFVGVKADGTAVNFPQVNVRIAPDTVTTITSSDEATALGLSVGAQVCDLVNLMPVPTAGGTPIVVGPRGYGIASLAVVGDALVATLDDATTVSTDLPTTFTDSDTFVADRMTTDGTATKTAMSAAIAATSDPIRPRSSARAVGQNEQTFNPMDFGAVGDNTADDSTAVQAAYAAAVTAGGGTLVLPRGRQFRIPSGLDMATPGISILGLGGWLTGGQVRIGHATTGQDFTGTEINRLLYDGGDAYGTSSKGVILRNARGVKFRGGVIRNVGKGVSIDSADGATGFHTLGMTHFDGVHFTGVGYGIYANAASWDVCSDWTINRCVVNFARYADIYMNGSDGLILTGNHLALANYASGYANLTDKTYNVYLGKTNQLIVTGNNFFEAGLSALRLDDAQNIAITANNFVWPGQITQADCIAIYGSTPAGIIASNQFQNWTHAAIGLYSTTSNDVARLEIGANGYKWLSTMASNLTGVTLDSTNTFRIWLDSAVTNFPVMRDYFPSTGLFDSWKSSTRVNARDQKGPFNGIASAERRAVSVTAATGIFTLSDFTNANVYGGLVHVQARSNLLSSAKTADYLLLVSFDGSSGRTAGCVTVSSTGLTAGAAADQPSFTWTLVSGALTATPVGSTSGSFSFEATAIGAVAMR